MNNIEFRKALVNSWKFFIQYNGEATCDDGWKLSIQGKNLDDAVFLYERLSPLLLVTKASFKFGTEKLFLSYNEEQKTKALTVYIPDGVTPESFAELVYLHIKDYKGGEGIESKESYTHYKNAIFFRNDRDVNGEYIPAKQK